jgi:hypothetical protein
MERFFFPMFVLGVCTSLVAAEPTADDLVKQLNAPRYADRERAEQALLKLGTVALPAIQRGMTSEHPEVVSRCRALGPKLRQAHLAAFMKQYFPDPMARADYDHPIWKHFKSIAGDTAGARQILANILVNADWANALDEAEADPDRAGTLYAAALTDLANRAGANMRVTFRIALWPGDQPEEIAFVMLLGARAKTDPDPLKPKPIAEMQAFSNGEERMHHGRGLGLGIRGKSIAADPKKLDESLEFNQPNRAEYAEAYSRIAGGWLEHRNLDSLIGRILKEYPSMQPTLLPNARRAIANRASSDLCRASWLPVFRRYGNKDDIPLLKALFHSKEGMDWPNSRFGANPGNVINQAEVREVAVGTALFLKGKHPADHGFTGLKDGPRRLAATDEIVTMQFTLAPGDTVEAKEKLLRAAIRVLGE